jgi:hypothetical protein
MNKMILPLEDGSFWWLVGPIVFVKQDDSHSCGPIAILKIVSVFGAIPIGTILDVLDARDLRKLTMDNYRGLVQTFSG